MRHLRYPQNCLGTAFESVVRSKRGPRRAILTGLIARIRLRYAEYLRRRRTIEHVAIFAWTEDEKEALEHCYYTPTYAANDIKHSVTECLRDDEIALCPYCLLRSPEQFDHLLPISKYPEFATLGVNLVWVCGRCNLAKGDRLSSAPRAVLNPYFDAIPIDRALLYCQIGIVERNLTLRFVVPGQIPGISQTTVDIAQRHCEEFSLFSAYLLEASALIAGLLRELASRFPAGLNAQQLNDEIAHQRARRPRGEPVNHWRGALWDGLEASPELHAYVQEFIRNHPPKPPELLQPRPRLTHLINWL